MANFKRKLHLFHSNKFVTVVNEAIEFFTQTPIHVLPPPDKFLGQGIYALYYCGNFEHYAKLSEINKASCELPIYVGKAVSPGWRTARINISKSPDIYRRLGEHSRSISQTLNLELDDFRCRFMIFGDIEADLIVPVEASLIRKYKPLWNSLIDGFGNHNPGKGRYHQAKSDWDVIHPGRIWADWLTGEAASLENLINKVHNEMDSLSFP
ncbi:MAG: restriction endonuclease [Candidatus Parabeggiatoa sp. nov. 3]|nr:MAG: restriction endonuclease [Gammaproteobacteria bacterium]RKZ66556.1 MAG: restriction endonuclease [Gammaproteobacteria bacterium]RKZ73460.1 MAG: restriction endonuclease [Gammaproteobacteria bacterium]